MAVLFSLIILPLAEIYLFVIIGSVIGASLVVLWCILSAFIGFYALRSHGRQSVHQFRSSLAEGVSPTHSMLSSLLIHIGGVCLLAPGLITDTLGLLCLFRPVRDAIIRFSVRRAAFSAGGVHFHAFGKKRKRGSYLEGSYKRRD